MLPIDKFLTCTCFEGPAYVFLNSLPMLPEGALSLFNCAFKDTSPFAMLEEGYECSLLPSRVLDAAVPLRDYLRLDDGLFDCIFGKQGDDFEVITDTIGSASFHLFRPNRHAPRNLLRGLPVVFIVPKAEFRRLKEEEAEESESESEEGEQSDGEWEAGGSESEESESESEGSGDSESEGSERASKIQKLSEQEAGESDSEPAGESDSEPDEEWEHVDSEPDDEESECEVEECLAVPRYQFMADHHKALRGVHTLQMLFLMDTFSRIDARGAKLNACEEACRSSISGAFLRYFKHD